MLCGKCDLRPYRFLVCKKPNCISVTLKTGVVNTFEKTRFQFVVFGKFKMYMCFGWWLLKVLEVLPMLLIQEWW